MKIKGEMIEDKIGIEELEAEVIEEIVVIEAEAVVVAAWWLKRLLVVAPRRVEKASSHSHMQLLCGVG